MEDRAYIHDDEYYYELIHICDVENTSRNKHVSIAILGRIAEALEKPIGVFFIGD